MDREAARQQLPHSEGERLISSGEAGGEKTGHSYEREAIDSRQELAYLLTPFLTEDLRVDRPMEPKFPVVFLRDISPAIQEGPMCGLVALTMAAKLLQSEGDSLPPARVHPENLLTSARHLSVSKQGEMFSVSGMLKVATERLKCQGAVVTSRSLSPRAVMEALVGGKAVLFPYDADKNHSPCLARGHKAHWCVLVGFAVVLDNRPVIANLLGSYCSRVQLDDSHTALGYHILTGNSDSFPDRLLTVFSEDMLGQSFFVFARHGKSRHIGMWNYSLLLESNGNLFEADPRRSCDHYVIPNGGIVEELCSQALVLAQTRA